MAAGLAKTRSTRDPKNREHAERRGIPRVELAGGSTGHVTARGRARDFGAAESNDGRRLTLECAPGSILWAYERLLLQPEGRYRLGRRRDRLHDNRAQASDSARCRSKPSESIASSERLKMVRKWSGLWMTGSMPACLAGIRLAPR